MDCILTMSIATLARKARATKGANISHEPFSINGTHRNQGWIGQTNNFRPNDSTWSLEDPTVIKGSVLSNNGMLATKYRWIRRPAPYAVVTKPADWQTQGDYVDYLRKKRVRECPSSEVVKQVAECTTGCASADVPSMPRKLGAYSQEEYIQHKASMVCESGVHFGNIPLRGSGAVCGGARVP